MFVRDGWNVGPCRERLFGRVCRPFVSVTKAALRFVDAFAGCRSTALKLDSRHFRLCAERLSIVASRTLRQFSTRRNRILRINVTTTLCTLPPELLAINRHSSSDFRFSLKRERSLFSTHEYEFAGLGRFHGTLTNQHLHKCVDCAHTAFANKRCGAESGVVV